jgi:hypothetical protein
MEEINTHTFIGGPKDGQRELMMGADVERGPVTLRTRPPTPLLAPVDAVGPSILPSYFTTYERTAYQGEKCRFIFWKAQGLSIDDAMRLLFAHYINRWIENDEQLERTRYWAAAFRGAAALHDKEPCPASIDPIIWESMRLCHIAEAERLEAEIATYERAEHLRRQAAALRESPLA